MRRLAPDSLRARVTLLVATIAVVMAVPSLLVLDAVPVESLPPEYHDLVQYSAWLLVGTGVLSVLRPLSGAHLPPEEEAQHLRVLVAEDNRINQVVVRRLLESFGAEVEVVDGGRAAVEAALGAEWHLVLMDVQMPEMDGHAATRAIRARERGASRLPIVALTANAMPSDREACLAAGMDDYLSKPVRRAELARLLARLRE